MASSQLGSGKLVKPGTESDELNKAKKSSAYDGGFAQHLADHGIYLEGYGGDGNASEPDNQEEIIARLNVSRRSLSPSRFTRQKFLDFKQRNRGAANEAAIMNKAFPIIVGDADIPSQHNLIFGNLQALTDGSITTGQPDIYDGSPPGKLDRRIRAKLGPYLEPSTNKSVPCLPNFFVEGKGPMGSVPVAERQACYVGALGARGVHKLRLYIDPDTALDNRAYTIMATYHGGDGMLKIYAMHLSVPTGSKFLVEYRMTQVGGWDMISSADNFRQGARALRNAREWAQEKRNELIAAANSTLLSRGSPPSTVVTLPSSAVIGVSHSVSNTSIDELAMDSQPTQSPAKNAKKRKA
ncbi:hypothetical protein MMC19_004320 [Ptychographa xylographoides]|nr:hypothetical protein [Ptychographa xylographoides]